MSRALLTRSLSIKSSDPHFTTIWKTDNAGTSGNDQIDIPLVNGESYDFTVYWGDGDSDTFTGSSLTSAPHTYTAGSGTYTVKIIGTFPTLRFANGGDRLKLIEVSNWGAIIWETLATSFYGCNNLVSTATDLPDFSQVAAFNDSFRACWVLEQDFTDLDVSSGENFTAMFFDCFIWNPYVANWQIQNATAMGNMFDNSMFSTASLNAAYNAFSLSPPQPNTSFGAPTTHYQGAVAQTARDILTSAPNNLTITDEGSVINDATWVSYTNVPSAMSTSQVLSISVTMRNPGPTTWTAASNYKLGSSDPRDNMNWGMNRVLMGGGDSIAPGQNKTFTFNITAPAIAGTYAFQWQMVQDGVEWFGTRSLSQDIVVS